MSVTDIAQYVSDGLAIALIIRLLSLRLHAVYRVFCVFLLADVLSSASFLVTKWLPNLHLDYRLMWMSLRPVVWVLYLWMVYALLGAILANFPGVLRLSRKMLNLVFIAALIIALLTAEPEYSASGLAGSTDPTDRILAAAFVLERVISMAAVFVLLAMLAFLLWFPVEMPRNLVVFSIGFVVFFSIMTGLLLAHTYWPNANRHVLNLIEVFLLAACYGYWLILINPAGEKRPVRIGHSWQPGEQKRLIGELESMNAALLRAARR